VLTTGTGSIFGFPGGAPGLCQSALLAPMFIVLSFGWGLAVFLIVQSAMYAWNGLTLPAPIQRRMTRLLGIFVARRCTWCWSTTAPASTSPGSTASSASCCSTGASTR
jgi:Ni/Fe-hydrogenase subunit HybB-like protein